jgi:hypothetical protein
VEQERNYAACRGARRPAIHHVLLQEGVSPLPCSKDASPCCLGLVLVLKQSMRVRVCEQVEVNVAAANPVVAGKPGPAGQAGQAQATSTLDASAASAAATPPPRAVVDEPKASGRRRKQSEDRSDSQDDETVRQGRVSAQKGAVAAQALAKKGKNKVERSSKHVKGSREEHAASASSRPSRACKRQAQGNLKEREYSSDSLMEESEDEDQDQDQDQDQAVRRTRQSTCAPSQKGLAPSSELRRGQRVRFSIDGEDDKFASVDGQISPIAAVADEEVVCFGEDFDTEVQEAQRERRRVAALEAVEGDLVPLQYERADKTDHARPERSAPGATSESSASNKRRVSLLETSEVGAKRPVNRHAQRIAPLNQKHAMCRIWCV